MSDKETIWPKKITVDKRIVSLLSVSTYDSFPRALKELITNSYDADAYKVEISIDPENEIITVYDDGKGMSEEDFEFYIRIAGKTREKGKLYTRLQRRIIGQFGVGFLAIFPFFKNYTIESKKTGSGQALYANIPLHKYFKEDNQPIDIDSITINGGLRPVNDEIGKSYTRITLKGFSDVTKDFFKQSEDKKYNSRDVDTYTGIERLKWILADDLPLKYRDDTLNDLFDYPEIEDFRVTINDEELFRENYGNEILESHEGNYKTIGRIKFKYFIATSKKSIFPYQARFMKVRNLNVGVGKMRDNFGQGHGTTRSRLHWLTGEVHILEGMNDMIKISRDDFNYSKDYVQLRKFLNTRLMFHSNRLEKEAELEKELKQTGENFKITNVKLLQPERIQEKVEKLKEEGIEVEAPKKDKKSNKLKNTADAGLKEAKPEIQEEIYEKRIKILEQEYIVTADNWDYTDKDEIDKACKIVGDEIIINSKYPLFQGKKYTDVFIKMNLMLTLNYQNKDISQNQYKKLSEDILDFFKEYY